MDSFDLHDVAERIKTLYTEIIRTHPSGRYANYVPSARWSSTWTKAASICLEYGFDPESHVRALLDSRCDANINPNMLLGSRAVERTLAFSKRDVSDEALLLQSQLAKVYGLIRTGGHIADILQCYHEDLTVSFRYAFAVRSELPEVAARYREAARLEMRLNRNRLDALRDLLPNDFIKEVEASAP